jgi:hypothetical protein
MQWGGMPAQTGAPMHGGRPGGQTMPYGGGSGSPGGSGAGTGETAFGTWSGAPPNAPPTGRLQPPGTQ